MRTISNLRGVRQILRIESAHVAIDESRVMEGTFTFDSTMVEGSVFQIGTAVADEINVTVVDPNGELNTYIDETYSVYIAPFNANRSQATWTLIGQYVVAELDTSYSGRAKVKFQDRMVTLDVPVDFQSGTLYANLQNLGLTLSLTQEETTFLSGLSVLNRQTMTKRDFIRGCALLMWENAYLKPDGKLAFRSMTSTAQTFTPSDRFSSELGDEVTIGPVRVIDDSGAVIYTRGSASGQKIEISSTTSPMISLIGSIEGLATYYSTATIPGRGIADFSYTPLSMSLLSTWALEPGDVVSYIDKDNNTYTSVVTSVAHVLNGASACTSAGEAKVRQSQQIPVQTDETRAVIQQLETGIDTAQSTASEAMPKYGSCDTAASTKAKVVTGIVDFSLKTGTRVALLMTNSNTANEPTLNINGTGAKPIVTSDGVKLTTSNNEIKSWLAGSMVTFVYDGTNWRIDDNYALTRINHIWADTLHGANGDINLKNGTFNYGFGKLVWDGSTLTVNGTIESQNGHIGSWDIGTNLLSTTVTIDDITYRPFLQVPNGDNIVNAFGVTATNLMGHTTYPFKVTYDGKLYATGAEINKATISGNCTITGTLTGGMISGSQFAGDYLNIQKGSIPNSQQVISTAVSGEIQMWSANGTGTSNEKQALIRLIDDGYIRAIATTQFNLTGPFYNSGNIGTGGNITASGNISSSGTITSGGNIAASISTATSIGVSAQNSESKVGVYAAGNGNRGLYDYTRGAWICYYNLANTRVEIPGTFYVASSATIASSIYSGFATKDTSTAIHAISSGRDIEILSQTNGAAGVYDSTNSKWVAYTLMDGTRGPVASTTENGFMSSTDKTKLNSLNNSIGAVSGQANPINSGTSNVDLLTSGIALAANHKYLFIYSVQWTSNATGRRHAAPYIDGTEIGAITTDNQTAINGAVTFNRGVCGITASSSARTLMIKGYQNSNTQLTATVRYQLIDLGT